MTVETRYEDRAKRFDELRENIPTPGDVLEGKDSEDICIYVDIRPPHEKGVGRSMYANAMIDKDCTGWYLTNGKEGLKVLISPESQDKLVEASGGNVEGLIVTKLRVIRRSMKNTSLIVEVI